MTVRVSDADGNPLEGITVAFAATISQAASPSTTKASGASATLSAASATTDADGIASITASANTIAGSYAIVATTNGLEASFQLTNDPLAATLVLGIDLAEPEPEEAITLTATVQHDGELDAGGTVDFLINGELVCAGVTVSDQGATCSAGPLQAGQYRIAAQYNGGASHAAAEASTTLLIADTVTVTPTPVPLNSGWMLALLAALLAWFTPRDAA